MKARGDGAYTVTIGAGEVGSPVVLTTGMVRAVACMFMTEADAYRGVLDADREPSPTWPACCSASACSSPTGRTST